MPKNLKLEDLEVYKVSMEIGEIIWQIVMKWDYFERKTLGAQIVDAADSIAFNISEGYGRFHFKENKNFCYYSRGSAKEILIGVNKVKMRKLISDEEYLCLLKNWNCIFG
jgi:four helix bundle protein